MDSGVDASLIAQQRTFDNKDAGGLQANDVSYGFGGECELD